ncbi:MAG TPA: glycosyltransferase, partial [Chroococcales cyanobacterium]
MDSPPLQEQSKLTRLSVIIPARNEEGCIGSTLHHLHLELKLNKVPHEIVVVDDSSTDGTWQILQELKQSIPELAPTKNPGPGGFGRAVIWGLSQARGDAMVIMMADESDDSKDVVRYWEKLNEGYDCVFGSRFIRGGGVIDYPAHKLFLNRLANLFIRILFNIPFNDTTNAFKAYRRTVIDGCSPLIAPHFNLTIEIPLKAMVRGYSWAVMPITWRNRRYGLSKLKVQEMGSRYLFICLYVWLEKALTRDYRKGSFSSMTNFVPPPIGRTGTSSLTNLPALKATSSLTNLPALKAEAQSGVPGETGGAPNSQSSGAGNKEASGDDSSEEGESGSHVHIDIRDMYRHRFSNTSQRRSAVWNVLVNNFFKRWISSDATVVDIGAGFCEFINHVNASKRIALDLNPDVIEHAAPGVEALVADVVKPWPVEPNSVDVCFSSNFIEHLPSKAAVAQCFDQARRALKDDGVLILMGPNVRFCPNNYWDFFDHLTPLSDRSLTE